MTSATDVLRRMLDERGVEWGNVRNDGSESDYLTEWQFEDNQGKAIAIEWAVGSGLSVEIHRYHLTPEQAIAATLGRGTCQDLGGTGANDEQVFNCSECGCVLSLYDRDGSNNLCTSFIYDYPRYCPECGRRIEQ